MTVKIKFRDQILKIKFQFHRRKDAPHSPILESKSGQFNFNFNKEKGN